MKVHLRKRKMRNSTKSNPRYTLYLDIYKGKRNRQREFLNIYLEPSDTIPVRKEKLELAQNIRAKRMLELTNEEHGFPSRQKLKQNFVEYFKLQMDKKEGNTIVPWKNTYIYLKKYTKGNIPFTNVNKKWLEGFTDYLLQFVGISSTYTYMGKIRCALNEAVRDGIILNSPGKLLRPLKVPEKSKEHLTIEEIQKIANTPFYNDEVKKAFLFSCFTGLRLCDIKKLKWTDIKETSYNGSGIKYAISIQQSKTKVVSNIPLN
ncbi:MAG: phage integrase SAM-like domain-containing protein [Mariniphaga sp.]|nr:phage integrase SAM-like domain-containing protein [Mariniphaga sp.]